MKLISQKKITVFLIILVLGIWGVIGYRLIEKQKAKSPLIKKHYLSKNQDAIMQRKPYQINVYSSDPFLGKKPQSSTKIRVQNTSNEQINWPALEYIGHLNSSKGDRYLFRINGKAVIIKDGEEKNGLQLKRKRNELQIFFKQQTKTFNLNLNNEKK